MITLDFTPNQKFLDAVDAVSRKVGRSSHGHFTEHRTKILNGIANRRIGADLALYGAAHIKSTDLLVTLDDVTVTGTRYIKGDDHSLTRGENLAGIRRCIETMDDWAPAKSPTGLRRPRGHVADLLKIHDRVSLDVSSALNVKFGSQPKTGAFRPDDRLVRGDTVRWNETHRLDPEDDSSPERVVEVSGEVVSHGDGKNATRHIGVHITMSDTGAPYVPGQTAWIDETFLLECDGMERGVWVNEADREVRVAQADFKATRSAHRRKLKDRALDLKRVNDATAITKPRGRGRSAGQTP